MSANNMSDIQFLNNPSEWPHLYLPVKKYINNNLICGIVAPGNTEVVEGLSIWSGWTQEQWNTAPKHKYESAEELLKEWDID